MVSMAGLDVYEKESSYFFRDCSDTPVQVCDGGTARCPEAKKATRSAAGCSLHVVVLGILLGSRFFVFLFFSFSVLSFSPLGLWGHRWHHFMFFFRFQN